MSSNQWYNNDIDVIISVCIRTKEKALGVTYWSFERKTYTWSSRKSSYFEIWRISHEICQISCEIHPKPYEIRCFNKNSSVWGVQGGGYDPGFHEILGHSPSPAFIKLNSFG